VAAFTSIAAAAGIILCQSTTLNTHESNDYRFRSIYLVAYYSESNLLLDCFGTVLVAVTSVLDISGLTPITFYGFTILYATVMATIKFLFGFLCVAFVCSNGLLRRYLLNDQGQPSRLAIVENDVARRGIVLRAQNELGVKELTGRNDGERIKAYLRSVNVGIPAPWCAAYVSYVYLKEGFLGPRSAWSPDLFPKSRLAQSAHGGDILGIYFTDLRRIAHVGIVEKMDGDWCVSLEGNTNIAGSRSGDGVYRRRRHRRTISKYADWVSPGKVLP
jgi:hypothetical protein